MKFCILQIILICVFFTLSGECLIGQQLSPGLQAEEPFRKEIKDEPWKGDFHKIYGEGARWAQFRAEAWDILNAEQGQLMPDWECLGPNTLDTLSGRVLCLTFDPNDSNVLYAGTGSGGLWKSVNGGDSWFPLTDDLPSMRVSAVAVNPLDSDVILIGTGIGQIQNTALQPGAGVLKSTDGGQTWNTTGFSFPLSAVVSTYELIWDTVLPGKVFLGATNGLFVSTDNGDTWTQLLSQRIYDIALNRLNPDTMYVGVLNVGVRRSFNGGITWTTLTNGIPSGVSVFRPAIAVYEGNPDIVFAHLVSSNGFGSLGLYKSIDRGNTWTVIPNSPGINCQPSNASNCSGWLFNTLGVSPVNPDHLFLGGVQFWTSTNGGQSWSWRDYASNGSSGGNTGLVYVDHWDIEFDPDNPSTVYVCSDGGVQKSTNGGSFWQRKSNDLINAQVYSVASHSTDPDFLIAGFHDHGLQRLDKSGNNRTWRRWSLNDGINTAINPQNPDILIGNIQNGVPYRSLNMGASHETTSQISLGITELGQWITPLVMNPENPSVLYTVSNAKIYKSTSSGSLWQASANLPNVRTLIINPSRPDTLYAHAYTSTTWTFYRSFDAGQNWEAVNTSTMPTFGVTGLASDPNNPDRIYAVRNSVIANNDHIKVSEDNGSTWTDITNDYPDIKINDIMVSPINEDHIYLATDLGVYLTTNRGQNWCPFNNNLPRIYVMDIDFYPLDSTIRIATFGRGVWQTKAQEALTTGVELPQLREQMALEVFPNPLRTYANIRFNLPVNGKCTIQVLDVQGQVVKRLFNGLLNEGEQSFQWDGLNGRGVGVSGGVYFIRVIFEGYGVVKKVVVE